MKILVGTPGRMLDHIQSNPNVRRQLQNLKVLVLDEADQLLDMGFRKSLDGIIKVLPQQRQTLLFSATVPNEVLLCVPSCVMYGAFKVHFLKTTQQSLLCVAQEA